MKYEERFLQVLINDLQCKDIINYITFQNRFFKWTITIDEDLTKLLVDYYKNKLEQIKKENTI